MDYEWAKLFERRCRARLKEKYLIYRGRCELKHNHDGVHALERGMEIVEFKTVYEIKLTKLATMLVGRELRKRGLEES